MCMRLAPASINHEMINRREHITNVSELLVERESKCLKLGYLPPHFHHQSESTQHHNQYTINMPQDTIVVKHNTRHHTR